jgi:hypothetical protein
MNLAYLRLGDAIPEGEALNGHALTTYSSLDEFAAAGEIPDGFIMACDDVLLAESCSDGQGLTESR